MAGRAVVRRRQVLWGFAGCQLSVVACDAGTLCLAVIEERISPACRPMTIFAGIGCLEVIQRLSRGRRPVMAAETSTAHLGVIE